VQELGAPVFLHATNAPMTALMPDFSLSTFIGYTTATALAGAHVMFGGVLETFPNLDSCLAHGGGILPMLLGRSHHGARVRPEVCGTTANAPMDLAKRLYYDGLMHSVRTLHFLMEMVGCGRIRLGSDYPFGMRDRDPAVGVNSLVGPSQQDIDAILRGTAAALLKLEQRTFDSKPLLLEVCPLIASGNGFRVAAKAYGSSSQEQAVRCASLMSTPAPRAPSTSCGGYVAVLYMYRLSTNREICVVAGTSLQVEPHLRLAEGRRTESYNEQKRAAQYGPQTSAKPIPLGQSHHQADPGIEGWYSPPDTEGQ
jgi:hypothetical protein